MNFEFNWGLIPFVIFNVVMVVAAIINIVFASIAVVLRNPVYQYGTLFGFAAFQLLLVYMSFVIPAIITILRDEDRLKITKKNKVIGVLTYMFFFYDFALAFLDGLFHPSKKKTWTKIKHTGEVSHKDIKKK